MELLWPDPETGPWLVRVWWRAQRGVPTPVGLCLTSWVDASDELQPGLHHQMPAGKSEVLLPRVDGRLLRSLPVGKIVAQTREQLHDRLQQALTGAADSLAGLRPAHRAVGEARLVNLTADTQVIREALDSGRRGRDLGDAHYHEVAEVYAQALHAGQPPTKAVAEHFTIEKSSAAKQVARARQRGFLPKTTRGRSGPATEEL